MHERDYFIRKHAKSFGKPLIHIQVSIYNIKDLKIVRYVDNQLQHQYKNHINITISIFHINITYKILTNNPTQSLQVQC